MGLAASQARLLLLTARKNSVEGQMMTISNEKLSLSRKAAQLSENYSEALNATKLTFNDKDLTYDLLMHPNAAAQNTQQYLVTDASGQVLLDSQYAALFPAATGGKGAITSTYATAGDFATACMGVKSSDTTNYNNVKNATNAITPSDAATATNGDSSGVSVSYSDTDVYEALSANDKNHRYKDTPGDDPVPLGGVDANGNYVTTYTSQQNGADSIYINNTKAQNDMQDEVNTTAGDISIALDSALGKKYTTAQLASMKPAIDAAKATAQKETLAYYKTQVKGDPATTSNTTSSTSTAYTTVSPSSYIWNSGEPNVSSDPESNVGGTSNRAKGNTSVWDDKVGNSELYFDRNQMIEMYLMFFDAALASPDATDHNGDKIIDYDKDSAGGKIIQKEAQTKTLTAKQMVSDGTVDRNFSGLQIVRPDQTSTSTPPTTSTSTTDATSDVNSNGLPDSYEEAYYVNLYNAINDNGWKTCDDIDNEEYFQTQYNYGNIAIKQNDSGSWDAISSSDAASPISSKSDDSSITKAEAEYNAAKDKLDYKESQLDISMNNLDTERAAVETEVDSVQKIIDKNISSSFKMFQASG